MNLVSPARASAAAPAFAAAARYPVILRTPDDVETWMTASADEALKLQRPLPGGALKIVARGEKEDPGGAA
jgi:putative SOS response-associated peptidase YedK